MPAYNVAKYMKDSIMSIQKQTYCNWELVVINDGSTDATREVAEVFALKDGRIRLYNQENAGVSKARNKGIELATGAYITFLDGDDLWDPQFLEKMILTLKEQDVNMVYCGNITLYENGKVKRHTPRFQYLEGNILLDYVHGRVSIAMGAILLERKYLYDNKIFFSEDCSYGEDVELITKIICLGKVGVVREELMTYCQRTGSVCNSEWKWDAGKLYSLKRMEQFIQENYRQNDKELVLKAFAKKIAHWIYRFLWKAVKQGHGQAVQYFLSDPTWKRELALLRRTNMPKMDYLKVRLVLSQSKFIWRILSL